MKVLLPEKEQQDLPLQRGTQGRRWLADSSSAPYHLQTISRPLWLMGRWSLKSRNQPMTVTTLGRDGKTGLRLMGPPCGRPLARCWRHLTDGGLLAAGVMQVTAQAGERTPSRPGIGIRGRVAMLEVPVGPEVEQHLTEAERTNSLRRPLEGIKW